MNIVLFQNMEETGSPSRSPRAEEKACQDPVAEVAAAGEQPEMEQQCDWDLPLDMLAKCFLPLTSMKDMAAASMVSKKWRRGMKEALAQREKMSFAAFRTDDSNMARMVAAARNLLELDIHFNRWGSCITDAGLKSISSASCCRNLRALSVFGVAGITDEGVIQLVTHAPSLEHLNVGGTFITDASLTAIARSCTYLKTLSLWGCMNVTEAGLLAVAEGCPYLATLNVGCLRTSKAFELHLLSFNPYLKLKPSHLVSRPVKSQGASSSTSVSFNTASYHLHSFVS